jgi:phospholipid/cholesterol/gamma-HCH transport system substrate-binding protein
MSSEAQRFKIGLFVVTGFLLMVAIIVWLGAWRFEDANVVEAFFTESVQGIQVDSPVKFRGVSVGRVRNIKMAPDGRLIEVIMSLGKSFKITDDLGIKINLLGLTGMKYLEMDRYSPGERKEAVELDFQPKYPVIATYPSDIKEVGSALELIFQKVKAVDVERASISFLKVMARLDKILADPKLDNLGGDAAQTMHEIKETARRFNEEVSRTHPARTLNRTLEKGGQFLQDASETVRNADRVIHRQDNNLSRLSQKLDRAADDLIEFLRIIKAKPSTLFYGTPEKGGH